MTTHQTSRSLAIIGAGLVGGAVFRELVGRWVHSRTESQTVGTGASPAPYSFPDIGRVHITARRASSLKALVRKTRHIFGGDATVYFEHKDALKWTIRCNDAHLEVDGQALDILPPNLTSAALNDTAFCRKSSLYTFLAATRPHTLVIGAGLAGMVAYHPASGTGMLALAWILNTLKRAAADFGIETIAVLGTTGLGGLGTNIVWTHQSSQEMDANLSTKILAAYGTLGVMDRLRWDTDSQVRWILLTPGSLLGHEFLGVGPVSYFSVPAGLPDEVARAVRENDERIPLYTPMELDRHALPATPIDWTRRRLKGAFLSGAQIKCGESGIMSPLQFACLSHSLQMGYNTDGYIAHILLAELAGRNTGYNQIPLGAGKVVEPSAQGQQDRNLILARLKELEQQQGRRSCPVYPALGSPRAQKEIVVADLIDRLLAEQNHEPTVEQLADYDPERLAEGLWDLLRKQPALLAEITAVIPVISPSGLLCTGPHIMSLGQGIRRPADLQMLADDNRFRELAVLGAVDLRPQRESIDRGHRVFDSGIAVMVQRARHILARHVQPFSSDLADLCGSALDPRTRYWLLRRRQKRTRFDPVFFVIQFLGGERPFY